MCGSKALCGVSTYSIRWLLDVIMARVPSWLDCSTLSQISFACAYCSGPNAVSERIVEVVEVVVVVAVVVPI